MNGRVVTGAAYTIGGTVGASGMVKLVKYEDVPAMCDQILDKVEAAGATFQAQTRTTLVADRAGGRHNKGAAAARRRRRETRSSQG